MKEIGDFLKSQRLEKGMSLQDISNITKISTRYLDGIEKGDWSMMPGNFYVRGFIRNYARVLGVDISDHLERLNREIFDTASSSPVAPITSPTSAPVRAYRFGKLFSTSLVVILLLVVFFVVFRYVSEMDINKSDNLPGNGDLHESQQYERPKIEPLPEKEPEPEAPEQIIAEVEFVEQIDNTYIFHVKNASELELVMQANQGECWYQVRDGNSQGLVKQEGKIQHDQSLGFVSDTSMWVRLGNFRAVSLYVNDQPIEIHDVGRSTSVRNFQFELASQ